MSKRILIVEDEPDVQLYLRTILEDFQERESVDDKEDCMPKTAEQSADPEGFVECPTCNARPKRKNLNRHRRKKHTQTDNVRRRNTQTQKPREKKRSIGELMEKGGNSNRQVVGGPPSPYLSSGGRSNVRRTCTACGGDGLNGRCYKCFGKGWT